MARTLYLIRHAHAGDRSKDYHDIYRQLSKRGHATADTFPDLFAKVRINRVLSSPATRCVQTVEPLAAAQGLDVIEQDDFSEGGFIPDILKTLKKLDSKRTVVCSHGDIIPAVIDSLGNDGVPIRGRGCEKGSIWVITYKGLKPIEARHVARDAKRLD